MVPNHLGDDTPVERDTLPPSSSHRSSLDPDETVGLVRVLHHAQQQLAFYDRGIDAARDANDEPLALFLEQTRDQDISRVAAAKRMLAARLAGETSGARGVRRNTPP